MTQRITLGELFDRHIKPRHNVVCVGAYGGPRSDPSLLKSAFITGKGRGSTTLLDSQVESLFDRLTERQESGKLSQMKEKILTRLRQLPSFGTGDPLNYLRQIRILQRAGANIELPQLEIASAARTRFKKKQFDWLVDAGSLPWIHTSELGPFSDRYRRTLERIIDEYARISRNAIILFDKSSTMYPNILDMRKFLDESGIKYTEHTVRNRYDMPLPNVKKRVYRHRYSYRQAMVLHFEPRQKKRIKLA